MLNVYTKNVAAAPFAFSQALKKILLFIVFLPLFQLARAQAPDIQSFSPTPHLLSFIPDSAGQGDTVTIRGQHFHSASTVSFGGVPAQAFSILGDSLIKAVVGSGASGLVRVATTISGDSLGGFRFIQAPPPHVAPDIVSFTPDSAKQGDTVILFGHHFDSVISVRFGGVPAQYFTVLSDSLIWSVVGTGGSGSVLVSTSQASDSLDGFTFIQPTPPLPPGFLLLNFSGFVFSDQPVLVWNVRHEQTIASYRIEHSLDSVRSHFTSIGNIIASGSDSMSYSFVDTALRTGTNFYRLRIIDSLGDSLFSRTVAINLPGTPILLSIYPNPASSYIVAKVPAIDAPSKFVLADGSGHIILTMPASRGVQQVTIPVNRVNKGVYKLVWSNGRHMSSQTVLIMK